jgi:hypothetical protein
MDRDLQAFRTRRNFTAIFTAMSIGVLLEFSPQATL